jgi:hypothetical protein
MSKELYEKNLQGLETFKKLSLEERLKFLYELGILEKEQDRYKLSKEYTGELNKEETDFDKKMKECHQYGLCIQYEEKPKEFFSVCRTCPLKKDKE